MTRFFTEWPTWEKLCFILACAIAVTLIAGAAKLGYTHWKLPKYVAVAEKEKREQAMQRQTSLRRNTSTREGANTSFGLEALEKGQVVEGIWVSRSNTPEPGSRAGSRSSLAHDNAPQWEEDAVPGTRAVQLEGQSYATYRIVSDQSRPSASTGRAECHTYRTWTSEAGLTKPSRSECPPSSMSKYTAVLPGLTRQDSDFSTIEAVEGIYDAAGPMRNGSEHADTDQGITTNGSSRHSSSESSESDPIAASAPKLLSQQSRPRQRSSDLDLMHSHRISLAAETGQLAPRRRAGPSGDWASIKHVQRPSTASEPEHLIRQQRSSSPAEAAAHTWSQSTSSSKFDALPAAVRRSSLPDVTPFAKFCKTAPASPLPEVPRLNGARESGANQLMENPRDPTTTAPATQAEAIAPVELPAPTLPRQTAQSNPHDPPSPKQGSFEHRSSAVIRGHGTGFEILKQGTFAAPPVNLQNGSRSRSNSTESRRKLQKRRRPSEESHSGPPSRASLV